jgi:hypothetical protein
MCALRRVTDDRAGPGALGILVPPGQRTVVVLRPRALPWDMLLVGKQSRIAIQQLERDEAAVSARKVLHALEEWSQGGTGRVVLLSLPENGTLVRIDVSDFGLIACSRSPGQAYRPAIFASREEAAAAAGSIVAVLCPDSGADQEYYFNTQNFAHSRGD